MYYPSSYDPLLVVASIAVAILASYTALRLAGRIHAAGTVAARWWLVGGAVAMGIGIWSMHFIGMLAFQLPVVLGYDPLITLASLTVAILTSGFALSVAVAPATGRRSMRAYHNGSAVVMGMGIVAMHYSGMEAMQMQPRIDYQPPLVLASAIVAIGASWLALTVARSFAFSGGVSGSRQVVAAIALGLGIVGMHYVGMAAAHFPLGSVCLAAGSGLDGQWLAVLVFAITFCVLTAALLMAVIDAHLDSRTARLAESLAQANRALKRQALYDPLTDLPNRTLLEDRLDQAIARAQRDQSVFALMFLDLDGFKSVNDSLGHYWGDRLLIELARRIRCTVRQTDTVARLAGDEFVILAPVQDADDAATLAQALLQMATQPFSFDGRLYNVSLSIGIAMYPADGSSAHKIMLSADAAMYHTKRFGRNGYSFFEASMDEQAHTTLALTQELRVALETSQFRLFYQPKLDCSSGKVTGFEALIRWEHPSRGLLAPDQFIGLAERSGLIVPMGEWVLGEACRQMKAWHDAGCTHWSVSVNLSALQFANETIVDTLKNALQSSGLAPASLMIEITETLAMRDVEKTMETLTRIKAIGVRVAIDDFGTGYSSLLYLKRFPADELKIDRGFIRDLTQDQEDSVIVSAIIGLGRALGCSVVAEGVETSDQMAFLKANGCDLVQGYLVARPLPAADTAARYLLTSEPPSA